MVVGDIDMPRFAESDAVIPVNHSSQCAFRSGTGESPRAAIPTTWRETANHSGGADYRREGRPTLTSFTCAVTRVACQDRCVRAGSVWAMSGTSGEAIAAVVRQVLSVRGPMCPG